MIWVLFTVTNGPNFTCSLMTLLLLAFPFEHFFVVRYFSGVHLCLFNALEAFIKICLSVFVATIYDCLRNKNGKALFEN